MRISDWSSDVCSSDLVFDNLAQSCWGELSMALRHRRASGAEELLTSITPINTASGCWAVITTHSTTEFLGTSIDQPYWKTIEEIGRASCRERVCQYV